MTNVEIWKYIVTRYNLLKSAQESAIQKEWELYFQEFFDYKRVQGEIDPQRNIQIGSRERTVPDIIIKREASDLFVVELKQYSLFFTDDMENQLFSYLDLTHLPVGILICDKIYLYFYKYDSNEKKRIEIPFEINNPYGINLIELLKKANFSKEKIEAFVDETIKFNANVNEIKNELTTRNPIDIIKSFFKDYYTSEEIECALKDYTVSITLNPTQSDRITPSQPTGHTPPPPTITRDTRDNTQYIFNGTRYGKAKLVLAVVKTYIQEHPSTTYSELKNIFPDNLQGSTGVFTTPERAVQIRTDPERRYYMNDLIRLSDNNTICISTQWGQPNIGKFLDKARSIGYQITPIN